MYALFCQLIENAMLQVQSTMTEAKKHLLRQAKMCKGIALLRKDHGFCDIVIKAGDTEVHAHKVVLAAQSAFFRAMLQACSGAT